MELVDNGLDIGTLIAEFGFPVIMAIGMGYFIYYIWAFIPSSICFNTVNIKNPITTATAIGTPTSETKVNISIT